MNLRGGGDPKWNKGYVLPERYRGRSSISPFKGGGEKRSKRKEKDIDLVTCLIKRKKKKRKWMTGEWGS